MKNKNDLIIKKYIKKVANLTPNIYRSRLRFELQSSISECFHDTPELTNTMIHERFGTPEHFANEYLSGMNAEELQVTLNRSKKQKKILFITLICLLVLLIPISIWILNEGDRHVGYHYWGEIEDYSDQ